MENETHTSEQKAVEDSASSVPGADRTEDVKISESAVIVVESTGDSQPKHYEREIVVKDPSVEAVTIPIDIKREQARYANLVANRGPIDVETSASQE